MKASPFPQTLMSLWLANREDCRPVGNIVADARAGALPGVEPLERGHGFQVTDKEAALAAMRGEASL